MHFNRIWLEFSVSVPNLVTHSRHRIRMPNKAGTEGSVLLISSFAFLPEFYLLQA